ncbi:MAG: hypothetical protein JSS79_19120 [Bacteroidetes bacterium]|nr:hypothetical protein [Bacteroidota bacterium]
MSSAVRGQSFTSPDPNPKLYVIKAEDKTLITDSNGVSVKEEAITTDFVVYVNPNWIESIEIVKGKEATDSYGSRGQNGVVVMTLNKEGFTKMRQADQEKFKKL